MITAKQIIEAAPFLSPEQRYRAIKALLDSGTCFVSGCYGASEPVGGSNVILHRKEIKATRTEAGTIEICTNIMTG